jgi:hypothetical protein
MAKKFITVEEYMGRRLTGGSYYQWMARMMQIISAMETGNQQFADYVTETQALLAKLSLRMPSLWISKLTRLFLTLSRRCSPTIT